MSLQKDGGDLEVGVCHRSPPLRYWLLCQGATGVRIRVVFVPNDANCSSSPLGFSGGEARRERGLLRARSNLPAE